MARNPARNTRRAAQLVRERAWHPWQKIRELHDGEIELHFRASSFPEIVRWVLSWGDRVRVLAPKALRDAVAQTARRVTGLYK
jgi:predicted DNA-binding transcriptional regulator YafY